MHERLVDHVAVARQLGPAENRLHTAAELPHREGLGDVVVRAQLETEDLVQLLGLRREHDDRDRALRPEPSADVVPVDLRQHHVEHDQVELTLAEAVERLLARAGGDHVVPVLAQGIREERLDRPFIVDQKDPRRFTRHLPGLNNQKCRLERSLGRRR